MGRTRKFSFDIPRLKIGPTKSDTRALKDHLSSQIDSPPPTPKSVRPPLSPLIEAELRSACASVLTNFKPSHIVYEEQYGSKQKQQLDYAAIKETVHREMESSAPALTKTNSRAHNRASAIMDGSAVADEDDKEPPISPDRFKYKPNATTEELFKGERETRLPAPRGPALRADQLMSPAPSRTTPTSQPAFVPAPVPTSGRGRSDSHLRSKSTPLHTTLSAPKSDVLERPRTAPRTDSVETTGSTPQTDSTDYPWSEKNSTAMTSAAVTPARGSKRTSSQALHPGSEASSMPKVEHVDADWMRQELDKHKKAQEERRQKEQQQEQEDSRPSTAAAETTPTQATTQAVTPVTVKIPARKPVPGSRAASRQESSRSESRQEARESVDRPRLTSREASAKEAPRIDSMQEVTALPQQPRSESRQESRQARMLKRSASRARSRARSISRQVQNYVRPGSAQGSRDQEDEPSRPSSRAGSVTRQVKDYFRPGSAMGSRKPSMDYGRSESRARSIDSFRSATSDFAPSTASGNKWKTWKPFHRKQNSESSRPGTSGSDTRGRPASREDGEAQRAKSKPAINLNRELPPLPGLDQWKDEEPAQPMKRAEPEPPKSFASVVSPASPRSPASTASHRSQRSRHHIPMVAPIEPDIGERDEILLARMGSPAPSSSGKPSMDIRRVPLQPSDPPPPPPPHATLPAMSANFSCVDDFGYEHFAPPTRDAPPVPVHRELKHERQRSKTMDPPHPPRLDEKAKNPSDSLLSGKAQVVNYSRVAGGPLNGGLSRKPTRSGHVGAATTSHTPVSGHSRNTSDSMNFSRKLSMDDYTRMQDGRYQNLVEISSSHKTHGMTAAKDGKKGKWWNLKDKNLKPPHWMDQVVKSGSRGGVMLTDDVAGAPIVRY